MPYMQPTNFPLRRQPHSKFVADVRRYFPYFPFRFTKRGQDPSFVMNYIQADYTTSLTPRSELHAPAPGTLPLSPQVIVRWALDASIGIFNS